MKWLSRKEEMVMLAVWRLRSEAYGISIREQVTEATGKYWSIGAIYDVLDRLRRKGLVSARTGEPQAERGGKSKRFYDVTRRGFEALGEVRELQRELWHGLPDPARGEGV